MGLGKEVERAEIVEYSVGRDRWIEISARFRDGEWGWIWEGVDMAVYNALDQWRKAVGDWLTGKQGRKEEVTGEIQLQLLDGSDQVVKTFVLKNAMLTALEAIELSYDDSGVVEVRARFNYDWIEER